MVNLHHLALLMQMVELMGNKVEIIVGAVVGFVGGLLLVVAVSF